MKTILSISYVVSLMCLWGIVLINDHQCDSRLKSLEASLHSAQQPQERNYFGVSDDTVFIKHGECITFKGQRIFAK